MTLPPMPVHTSGGPDRHAATTRQRRVASSELLAGAARLGRLRSVSDALRRLARQCGGQSLWQILPLGGHRPGRFAVPEPLGFCRQRAADRPRRPARAAAGSMRPISRRERLRRTHGELRSRRAVPDGAARARGASLRTVGVAAERRRLRGVLRGATPLAARLRPLHGAGRAHAGPRLVRLGCRRWPGASRRRWRERDNAHAEASPSGSSASGASTASGSA